MATVFVCFFKTGSCEDLEKHPLVVFSTKEKAEAFCQEHNWVEDLNLEGTEITILGKSYFSDHYSCVYFTELPFVS